MPGASADQNPNLSDLPGYGSTTQSDNNEDQQVMGATTTHVPTGGACLNLDGEVVDASLSEGQGFPGRADEGPEQRNPGAQLNGATAKAKAKAVEAGQRMGSLFSEVSAAVQGVVKASAGVRGPPRSSTPGAGSAGTVRTTGTAGTGYVSAVSDVDAGETDVVRTDVAPQGPLFSPEQAERLETMAKAAPLLYPEPTAPELPHSVSSESGDAIQTEVRRQLQQFMSVQAELERRAPFIAASTVTAVAQVQGPMLQPQLAQVPEGSPQVTGQVPIGLQSQLTQVPEGSPQVTGQVPTGLQSQPTQVPVGLPQVTGAASSTHSASTEVVRPGISELTKLPSPTLEGALGFADWVHAIRPAMSDLSDSSGECWERLLADAQDWYHNQYVPATPLARVRTKYATSPAERDVRWTRVRHRMEHLIIQACPDTVKSELSAARISGVMSLLCKLHMVYKPGGVAERSEALRQIQSPLAADSPILKLRTWRRWLVRLTDLGGSPPDPAVCIVALEAITGSVLKSLPNLAFRVNLVRASLNIDTQPSTTKVSEFYEHMLAELEGVSRVSEAASAASAGRPDANKVRQVDAKALQGTASESAAPAKAPHPKTTTPPSSGGDAGKRLCRWYHDGKGCRKGGECSFVHDWSSIPKADRASRCMRCGGQGHKKDTCPAPTGSPKARSEAGNPKAHAKEAPAKPKADAGLKKVLSEAAGVLREAFRANAAESDSVQDPGSPTAHQGIPGGESASAAMRAAADPPVMATAAKIEAQLQDLEARVMEGQPRIRAVEAGGGVTEREQTALLDSGATHAVLDPTAVRTTDLSPCMVSLAGDQRQWWRQTPGGSLVAPAKEEGGETQTILPLGSLVEQLGCSIRWTKKAGLQLHHPRLGKLETSIRSGCPQLSKKQALELVRELEGAHIGDLESRLRRIQSQLSAQTGQGFQMVLDEFISTGSQVSAQKLVDRMPFLKCVPTRVTSKLAVGLEGAQGWDLLKALPVNRRLRKRLHASQNWVLSLCSGRGDPKLKARCQEEGYELVEVDLQTSRGWDLTDAPLWKALCWAAFTGRISAILDDPPIRTWQKTDTGSGMMKLRTYAEPWGVQGLKGTLQAKVDEDTLVSVQPLWLWTVASVARGKGVPMCFSEGEPGGSDVRAWKEAVMDPFAEWSNCCFYKVPWTSVGAQHTRPLRVCSNLQFSPEALQRLLPQVPKPEVAKASWPEGFRVQVAHVLFGHDIPSHAEGKRPRVRAVDRKDQGAPSEEEDLMKELDQIPLGSDQEGPPAEAETSPRAAGPRSKKDGCHVPLSPKERDGWKRHLQAHHLPFRRDCLQCVMSGSLGLQHRRVRHPAMYALSYDLAGPFKELGKDDRGGRYKYALVAGLRVPTEALPAQAGSNRPRRAKVPTQEAPQSTAPEAKATDRRDKAEVEASEPRGVEGNQSEGHSALAQEPTVEAEERESVGSYDLSEVEDLQVVEEEPPQADGEPQAGEEEEMDPWEDREGILKLSDEEFDEQVSRMGFSGENQILRFVVPMKGRSGAHFLPAFQEVVAECNRLGYPVKVAHTDRAREAVSRAATEWMQANLIQPSFTQGDDPKANGLAERLVGWVKTKARLHLAAAGLGYEHWPTAMALACAEHRHRVLQLPGQVHQYGQRVVYKSKHPTGESKKPFLRWEYATYLTPCSRTDMGHLLLRESTGAYIVARNVRPLTELVDPEREFGEEQTLEAELQSEPPAEGPQVMRRVTGKRSVKAVELASERLAEALLKDGDFSLDACSQVLEESFRAAVTQSRRTHRGPVDFNVVLGAYSHGGIRGVTRVSRTRPSLCRYLNAYLRDKASDVEGKKEWASLMVMQADQVAMHKDTRNEPGTWNYVATVSGRKLWVSPVQSSEEQGETDSDPSAEFLDSHGRQVVLKGRRLGEKAIAFDPKQHHALTEPTDWVIAGYSPLGTSRLPEDDRYARIPPEEWRAMCELDEAQFEESIGRWTRVLSGADEVSVGRLSAAIPRGLLVGTLRDGVDWNANPILEYRLPTGEVVPIARVFQFTDDDNMYLDDSPFPDRLMMFDLLDMERNVREVVVLRVLIEETLQEPPELEERVLQVPGPLPIEIRALQVPRHRKEGTVAEDGAPRRLPIPLPNPAFLESRRFMIRGDGATAEEEHRAWKAEVAMTENLEGLLSDLKEPLSVTHTASQAEVRQHLERWRPAIEKELEGFSDRSIKWGAYTCDIRSAFTLTPIPKEASRRYVLRPPKWLIELGLAQEGECYTLGRVLYGFREAPVWWSEFRDDELRKATFAGCRLVQGKADPSIWKIMSGSTLKGFLITYVDDFLVLSEDAVAKAFHAWILEGAKWETDGLAEASQETPVRFLGMQLKRYEDGSFTLDQEAYVDELTRAHGLTPAMRSKITCPKEVMYGPGEEASETDQGPPEHEAEEEGEVTRQAQRIAGECLWLSQRTRMDISFTTSVMCSLVATNPGKALAIGRRLLMYLAQTRDYKLRLKCDPQAPILRIYTDASFSPEGRHSYGGHVLEFKGAPAVWRAGRQQIIAMSSAEAELIQVVEGCTYGESFLSLLGDLQVQCKGAQVEVDNTAAIALVKGGCSQRTRHLKVRGAKLNQLLHQGWSLSHCQGVYQKADILTKPLPSARLRFLCEMLGLGPEEGPVQPKVQKVQGIGKVFKVCLAGLLASLQGVVCKGETEKPALEVEWPWELLVAMLLIILSTVCLWETVKGSMSRQRADDRAEPPRIRAVAATKERRSKRLQDRVTAAIESVVSETSPSGGSEHAPKARRNRNKCPTGEGATGTGRSPVIQAGVVHVHGPNDPRADATAVHHPLWTQPASSSTSMPPGFANPHADLIPPPPPETYQVQPPPGPYPTAQFQGSGIAGTPNPPKPQMVSQITQTDPVIVLSPESSVYNSAGGHCIHMEIGCRGLRNAGHIHTKNVCQYCLRKAGPRSGF
ncbi:GIP [Symbiodinium sp. CCMP2592]|nr:GIP [Symbiodinium sp. CCMP2592]